MTDYKLCNINDVIEEESVEFDIETEKGTESIFAVKKDGILSIFRNNCPHLGVQMNLEPDRFLDVEKNFILCSTHGALFKIDDGECVHGPCLGQKLTPVKFKVEGEEVFISKDL